MDRSAHKSFVRYQGTAAGRLRYALAQHNLKTMHPRRGPLRVLDAAGGDGIQTLHLAERGHRVTLFDADAEMLARAERRLVRRGLIDACEIVQGTLSGVADSLPAGSFDLILCHHALEYTDGVAGIFAAFARLAHAAGELSIVTLNPASEVIRGIVFARNPSLAESRLDDTSFDAKWFGPATLLRPEQIRAWARAAAWSVCDFRGIRVLADYMGEEVTRDRERELLRLETRLAGLDPYRSFGRYLQFRLDRSGEPPE